MPAPSTGLMPSGPLPADAVSRLEALWARGFGSD
jgi:hypothetical protein